MWWRRIKNAHLSLSVQRIGFIEYIYGIGVAVLCIIDTTVSPVWLMKPWSKLFALSRIEVQGRTSASHKVKGESETSTPHLTV